MNTDRNVIANYHSHTSRCRHATGTEREYIEHAIDAGIKILGFSDHAPHPFKRLPFYISPIRMTMSQFSDYCETVNRLKDEYRGQIEIHLGLELEYWPSDFDALHSVYVNNGVEYVILGAHFIGSEPFGRYSGRKTSRHNHLRKYVDQSIEAFSTGCFTYMAHPDIINFTGDDDIYEEEMDRLCKAALKYDVPLEINLLGLNNERHYPNERFFKLAARNGNKIIFGLDAHSPEAYDNKKLIEKGFRFAESCEVTPDATVKFKSL